ncbi:hypothetical protein P4562_18925 [Lysinibacillus xylanilyticus]|uniref:hypothetical protein n=1 Tax=Lysinibacillus xylanilyticus TaxID=582475 RepID=UPI002E23A44A|nr:hypothetical protein [Lysinibacillus xylanilyticus]
MDEKKICAYYKEPIDNNEFENSFGKIEYKKYNFRVVGKESREIQEVKIYLNDGDYSFDMVLNEGLFYMRRGIWMLETEIMDDGKVVLKYDGNHRFQFLKLEDQITLVETGELELDISNYDGLVELINRSIGYI